MSYRLDPARPAGAELARIAGEDLDDALDALTGAAPTADDVHSARKKLKRVRAVVRMGRGVLGSDRASDENAVYRDVGRLLSDRRDADVLVETADRLWAAEAADTAGPLAPALAALRDRLTLEAKEIGDLSEQVEEAVSTLTEARRRLRSWPDDDAGWEGLEVGVASQYRKGRKAFGAAVADTTDEHLHDFRKRAKDHWYHLRLLRDIWPPVVKALQAEAHHLADLLGDDHDLAVLTENLDEPSTEIEDVIAAHRAPLQEEARTLAARLYVDPPKAWVGRLGAWWEASTAEGAPEHPGGS